jgi:hypothetical protein
MLGKKVLQVSKSCLITAIRSKVHPTPARVSLSMKK